MHRKSITIKCIKFSEEAEKRINY